MGLLNEMEMSMKWKNKGREFETIAKNFIDSSYKYYLWGAGKTGIEFLEKYKNDIKIAGFIDSSTEKIGKRINDYEIFSIAKLKKIQDVKIIITINEYRFDAAIKKTIEEYKLKENIDYMYYLTYGIVFNMYKNKLLNIPHIRIPVTERCTLKCKDCISRITDFEKPVDYRYSSIKDDIDSIFEHIDFVDNFRFVGGEPFLHRDLKKLVKYVGENYRERVNDIVIVSNGTIIPEPDFFKVMEEYRVTLRLSDYKSSVKVKDKQRIEEIKKMIAKLNNIKLEIAIDNGIWHQYCVKLNTDISENRYENFYSECLCAPTVIVKEKKLYTCVWHATDIFLNGFHGDVDDYFDLSQSRDDRSKYILMEYLLKYTNKGYISGCRSCFGEKPIHQRYIEAAIQKE